MRGYRCWNFMMLGALPPLVQDAAAFLSPNLGRVNLGLPLSMRIFPLLIGMSTLLACEMLSRGSENHEKGFFTKNY